MILSFMIMSFFHDYVITNSLLRFISPKSDLPAEMKHTRLKQHRELALSRGVSGGEGELGPLSKRWQRVLGKQVAAHPSSLPAAPMASLVNNLGDYYTHRTHIHTDVTHTRSSW